MIKDLHNYKNRRVREGGVGLHKELIINILIGNI